MRDPDFEYRVYQEENTLFYTGCENLEHALALTHCKLLEVADDEATIVIKKVDR